MVSVSFTDVHPHPIEIISHDAVAGKLQQLRTFLMPNMHVGKCVLKTD